MKKAHKINMNHQFVSHETDVWRQYCGFMVMMPCSLVRGYQHFESISESGWDSGKVWGEICRCIPDSHPHSDKYQVSHRYSYFSWWWAHSCPKYVEKRNKHTKKNCAPHWLYLQNYRLRNLNCQCQFILSHMKFQKNIK